MESLQGSWQYEVFSSAKEISPPISPAPPSPTLYSLGLSSPSDYGKLDKELGSFDLGDILNEENTNSSTTSVLLNSHGATSLLPGPPISPIHFPTAMGQITNINASLSDFTDDNYCYDEQSINLDDFLELDGLDDARVKEMVEEILPPTDLPDIVISEDSMTLTRSEEELDKSFESILSELGLPKTIGNNQDIPLIFAQELLELQDEGEDLGLVDETPMEEDSDNCSVGSPNYVSQEIVVYTSDDSQSQNSIISIESSNSDSEDEAQELTLDALIRGDYKTASEIYPAATIITVSRPKVSATTKAAVTVVKPESRGRKPSSAPSSSKSWVNVTDKVLRKKEQNKTAATRYRQKKKLENIVSLDRERELEGENNLLMDKKNDLAKEIKLVKQLMFTLFSSRKNRRF